MKLVPTIRALVFAGLGGVCAVGMLSSSVGCGSDSGSSGGKGGSGGGTGGAGGGAGHGGSGGTTGNGGAGGSSSGNGGAGGSVVHKVNYTFDTSAQGWMLNTYFEPANLGGVAPPSDGGATDASTSTDAGTTTPPTVTFDSTMGNPSPGSLKVTATYTAYNQYVDALINPSPAIDLTGATLHVKVMLVSVSNTAWTGGVQIHASTGAFVYGNPTGMALTTPGVWVDVPFDLSIVGAAGWDPSMVVQFGVQFYSGSAPTTPATFPISAVFAIDTFTD
jgi:hypothetical protein